ncbi:uncharacterized protein EAE97_009599 [Botrytis byssoidea]|uniref:Uncharacterized protein n=1 Tax=Botrytis byssoidea TaxID=139641 RepID=A0A9P5I882_9HELO|nr:uncharacterized protein EAE97_009599 [Botrytis byssoidea]KAF7930002.1 hypothetical protein EAE97_009599 [Botrytis byssoidea]
MFAHAFTHKPEITMTNPANMTSPEVHQCESLFQTLSYYSLFLLITLIIFPPYFYISKIITIFFSTYPTSNYKIATFQPHLWKNTVKGLVSLTILMILDLDFIFYYGIYYIASKSHAFSHVKQGGKLTLLAFMLTLKLHWLLVVTVYEIGEVLADETLSYERIIGRLKGMHKTETDADNKREIENSSDLKHSESQPPSSQARDHLFLNLVDFDTKEEGHTHLDKHATVDESISPTFSLSPFHFTRLRSRITITLPSPVRSRIREMIDSATQDLQPVKRHKAVRMIVETEQYTEKLYSRSKSNIPRMVEQLEGLERKLKDIFVNAEMTAANIEAGVLTPSTSSGEWTPVALSSTHAARSEFTFGHDAEDEDEDMPSGSLTPLTSSSRYRSSPSPTTTIY